MSKTVVVVNPKSQNGALGRRWSEIDALLRREIGPHEVVHTRGPRDATRLAREALRGGADTVVAVGGDGTIHEVVNGFFEDGKPIRPEAALGVLPFGTGGDFRKTAGIPHDLLGAARLIAAGHTRAIDLGLLEYRAGTHAGAVERCVFVNIASFGMGGLVDQIVNRSSKVLGGKASFLIATVQALFRYRNQPVSLVFDGDEAAPVETKISNVAVANGRYFGGGMFVAPDAELDDGLFDVILIGDISRLDTLTSGPSLYRGTHLRHDKVSARRAARLEARPLAAGADVLLDVDGEAPGALPASFTVLPRSLNLVSPAHV